MVTEDLQNKQLKQLSLRFRFFGRSEIKELRRLLEKNELVHQCVYGFYQGGSGILVTTTKRVLLVDKRPFYLNLEDMHYENIHDTVFSSQFLQGTLYVHAGMRKIMFKSISDARLREIKEYIHEKISNLQGGKQEFYTVRNAIKPYLNPAWRARHNTVLKGKRSRPTKFYPSSSV